LSSNDRKSSERNTVEFIEATPKTRLANTLEDLSHISEFVLIRAVSDDDENTKSTTKILYSFSLTGTGRSSGSTTIHHTESLRKSNVTSISEGSDTETLLSTEELILVNEFDISNCNCNCSFFNFPVAASVLEPIEVVFVLNFVSFYESNNLFELVTLVYLNRHKSFDFGSNKL
jgi:hypothetical protein